MVSWSLCGSYEVAICASGNCAGPLITFPVLPNCDPWQGHSISVGDCTAASQPWCVQIKDNPMNAGGVACVRTTARSRSTCTSVPTFASPGNWDTVIVSCPDGTPPAACVGNGGPNTPFPHPAA